MADFGLFNQSQPNVLFGQEGLIPPISPQQFNQAVVPTIPSLGAAPQQQQQQGLFDSLGGFKGIQGGVDIASGLTGIAGLFQQNQRANEAINLARQDQAQRRQAFADQRQFRGDVASAFGRSNARLA